jgi:hypothetical protein
VLARDSRTVAICWAAATVAGGLTAGLPYGLGAVRENHVRAGLTVLVTNGLAIGAATAIMSGVIFSFLHASWGSFAITRCWLAARRLLPLRLMEFLSDAHEQRGVLRQVGAIYQFRHAELQRHLADRDPST